MSEIHSKISLDRFLPFPLSIDFDFYLLATQVFGYTRNYTDFSERSAGLSREKLGAYKPEEDFKPGFEEKIRLFWLFLKIIY